MITAIGNNTDAGQLIWRRGKRGQASAVFKIGKGQGEGLPLLIDGEGRAVIMPRTARVVGAQMNEIGLIIAARADRDAGKISASIRQASHIKASTKLDETTIVGGADIACHAGCRTAIKGHEIHPAIRDAAHHTVAEKAPIAGRLRRHVECQCVLISQGSAAAGERHERNAGCNQRACLACCGRHICGRHSCGRFWCG